MARAPLQKGEDSRKNWTRINAVDRDVEGLRREVVRLSSEVEALRGLLRRSRGGMHPFRVYRMASALAGGYSATGWRTFRVRAGSVIFDSVTPVAATGTDGANEDPDADVYLGDVATTSFTVASGVSAHWVWLEVAWSGAAWSVAVKNGATPASNGWVDWPAFDGRHVVVAKIDTSTHAATKEALVRQYLRGDLVFGPKLGVCVDDVVQDFVFPALIQEVP